MDETASELDAILAKPLWWMPAALKARYRDHFRFTFNPNDGWWGYFRAVTPFTAAHTLATGELKLVQIYICLVPYYPVRISWITKRKPKDLRIGDVGPLSQARES
jgi:hypothetical protein